MNKNLLSKLFIIITGLLISIVMAVSMMTSPRGGLAAMVPLIIATSALISLVNPKRGLLILIPLVIWVDEFKRLAVYFGGAYSVTVMQVLAMPLIVLACLNIGFLLDVLFRKTKVNKLSWFLYLIAPVVGAAVFFSMDSSLSVRGQRAANIGMYMTLVPILTVYFGEVREWRRYLSLQVFISLPAAAWAIKQYYFGFDSIEWEYAESGLSKTHYNQMFIFAEPRVFGFFGSASAIGCLAIYCAFSWMQGLTSKKGFTRFIWILLAIFQLYILVLSTQRTALVYPIIVFLAAWFFRTKIRTCVAYISGLILLFLGIMFSTSLLNGGLEDINKAIEVDSAWGKRVLKVSTFSDRLRGWERLKRAETYSLLGTKKTTKGLVGSEKFNDADYNHDIINKILIHTGLLGLFSLVMAGSFILWKLHQGCWIQADKKSRNWAAFTLALVLPMVVMSMLGGGNFNTNPINLQIWSTLAGVFIWRANAKGELYQSEGGFLSDNENDD